MWKRKERVGWAVCFEWCTNTARGRPLLGPLLLRFRGIVHFLFIFRLSTYYPCTLLRILPAAWVVGSGCLLSSTRPWWSDRGSILTRRVQVLSSQQFSALPLILNPLHLLCINHTGSSFPHTFTTCSTNSE